MKQALKTICGIGLFAVLFAVPGCGDDKVDRPYDLVPAGGVVIYKGQPVEGATVTFHPAEAGSPMSAGKPAARAKTNAQGRFRLWTFDLDDGALPGDHVVTISKVEIVAPDIDPDVPGYDPSKAPADPPPRYLVPERFGNRPTSDLKATVTPEGPNEFEFALDD